MGHTEHTYHENLLHDLIQPLNNIYATTDYLETLVDSSSISEYLGRLKRNAQHMQQLIRYTQAQTAGQGERSEAEPQPVELVSWLSDLVADCYPHACARQIYLSFDTNCSRVVVSTHRLSLERILRNLISNAVKHTAPGTDVLVDIELNLANPETVQIHVRDNGPGMSLGTASQVFERYHTTQPMQGSGLGLAIVWELAQQIGADIGLRNNRGTNGCQFTLEMFVN